MTRLAWLVDLPYGLCTAHHQCTDTMTVHGKHRTGTCMIEPKPALPCCPQNPEMEARLLEEVDGVGEQELTPELLAEVRGTGQGATAHKCGVALAVLQCRTACACCMRTSFRRLWCVQCLTTSFIPDIRRSNTISARVLA